MPPAAFETAVSASAWPDTHAFDGAATGIVYQSLASIAVQTNKQTVYGSVLITYALVRVL
jgi:hypothetical protein